MDLDVELALMILQSSLHEMWGKRKDLSQGKGRETIEHPTVCFRLGWVCFIIIYKRVIESEFVYHFKRLLK